MIILSSPKPKYIKYKICAMKREWWLHVLLTISSFLKKTCNSIIKFYLLI